MLCLLNLANIHACAARDDAETQCAEHAGQELVLFCSTCKVLVTVFSDAVRLASIASTCAVLCCCPRIGVAVLTLAPAHRLARVP